MLGMAVVALHAQKAMFQATAFEVGFEFALNIPRQNRALLG
jgi:nucleoside 2-deoxyribosyltransferase